MITFLSKCLIDNQNILFFDLDGTLIETDYANYLAYKVSIETVTKFRYSITYNPSLRINRTLLIKQFDFLSEEELHRIIIMKEIIYTHFLHETTLNKNVLNILTDYCSSNKCILVTNSYYKRVKAILNYHDLNGYFHRIIPRNLFSIDINKYQRAIKLLNIKPEYVVIYEDNEKEMQNAREIGISMINPLPIVHSKKY